MSETARYADVVLPGSLHEEEEGHIDHCVRAAWCVSALRSPLPGEAHRHLILPAAGGGFGRADKFTVRRQPGDLSPSWPRQVGRHRRLRGHHLGALRAGDGVFGHARPRATGHAAFVRGPA